MHVLAKGGGAIGSVGLSSSLIQYSIVFCIRSLTYGTGHAKVYKITRAAFKYSSKTRELSLSTRASLAHCCSAVPRE